MSQKKLSKISVDSLLKVSVIIAILVGTGALGYRYVYYLPAKDKTAQLEKQTQEEKEKREQEVQKATQSERELDLDWCITDAEENYNKFWNSECKSQGLQKNCRLPRYNADRVDESKEKEIDECYRRYQD